MKEHTTAAALVVPVDVAALCVGIIDQNDQAGTSTFAGATTSFQHQTGDNDAFLGANVVRDLTAPPLQQLTAGIHLHWALPEALTKGTAKPVDSLVPINPLKGAANPNDDGGGLVFQAVPNRWLVSRLVVSGRTVTRKTWVVESDVLNTQLPAGQLAVSLPVAQVKATDADYQFVGQYQEFAASWTDPGSEARFAQLTGRQLSAVASGDSSFAAFYPNSRSLFGFYDELADVKVPAGTTVNVMYQLTGWFSSTANDPLQAGKTRDQLNTQFGWTFGGPDDATVTASLYSGTVQNITWNPNTRYIVDQPHKLPIEATVAIGNNPAEAFSAYFRDLLHPEIPFFETLLNALQNGLLTEFQQPQPDQLAQLEEALHQQTFGNLEAGTIYQVVRKEKDQPETPENNLPLLLEETLNWLNICQQQVDDFAQHAAQFQWQLFADWYRLMQTQDPDQQTALYQLIYAKIAGNQPEIDNWPQIQQTATRLKAALDDQLRVVKDQLDYYYGELLLRATSAPRYWQPNEPVVLLVADELKRSMRQHTIRAHYDASGYLPCRLDSQLLTAIEVKGTAISTALFASAALPQPNKLPRAASFDQLLLEACLLNTNVVSALSGVGVAELTTALKSALRGTAQTVYFFTGTPPSKVAMHWWSGNAWQPIFSQWTVAYYPLEATETAGELQRYTPDLFTANFVIDQNQGGAVRYSGALDPGTIDFTHAPFYRGSALLSSSTSMAFQRQLTDYLVQHPDSTLQQIADDLQDGHYITQALSGFNNQLLMQQQSLQLNIKVGSPSNPNYQLTQAVAQISGRSNTLSPLPNGSFNPIRAGYLQFSAVAVDIFGQKRTLNITKTITSEPLTTYYQETAKPNIVYLPARLAQPTRLLFRWLAAAGDAIQEMNAHPATTPVCGWFLPNHLDGSLFVYSQEGKALGTLYLTGDRTTVKWQSAPGNTATINQPIATVFALQNARLRETVTALATNGVAFFIDFWKAVDNMHNFIDPQNYAQSTDLAVLVGRPVALTEALLRLDVQGGPALNQSWATVGDGSVEETDNSFTKVRFPVVLGDLNQINDGLIGYFLNPGSGYDFSNFYTQGAPANSGSKVQKPTPTTITLTAASALPGTPLAGAQLVLMLIDPRAQVHATTGILPTKTIDIPADQYTDTLSILEMTFLTTPVLQGATGLALPLPTEAGYQWSWVEEIILQNAPAWGVTPDITYVGGQAVATYTQQTIREGWLRLSPQLLGFSLLNDKGQPAATTNAVNSLTLLLTNSKPQEISFVPGQPLLESQPNSGSVFYVHFGRLVAQADVPAIVFSAAGWQFKALNDARHGHYWVATPLSSVTLPAGKSLSFSLANVKTASLTGQVQLYYDYYNLTGLNDGVDDSLVTLVQA